MTTHAHTQTEPDLEQYCNGLADRALAVSRKLSLLSGEQRNAALSRMAVLLEQRTPEIVEANARDLMRAENAGLGAAMIDRLKLDAARIGKMAASVRQIAQQVDPVGQVIEGYVRPNGLSIQKVRVPLGVVFFIYESRPNVTSDAAALCIKSGNALILRGGKEASESNAAITAVIREALTAAGIDADAVQFVSTPDRAAVGTLLKMDDRIDVVIPRGGESLIRAVVEQSHIPVIKHYTGNCHVYVDQHAGALGEKTVIDICVNAKVQRPGVCNAAESMLFHADATDLLAKVGEALAAAGVEMRGCERTRAIVKQAKPADESDWATEFLDKIVAIKVVDDLDEAIAHINRYGSRHTDAILTADVRAADAFVRAVDSANVMVNTSTRFSDGGEYGLGAEIGISTDKLHARGPMGAADMTTYKWVVRGNGQIRK
ncbi:MAG: glutamate-5-semialdehyde dehydrogenase [Planctomycetes bacterium]|nr:glutamate-5-semialdehyde dehydrogenase [Planctomycetota bacterium]